MTGPEITAEKGWPKMPEELREDLHGKWSKREELAYWHGRAVSDAWAVNTIDRLKEEHRDEAKAREAAARREALLEAREDIRARRRTFSDLNADPQYLAAMDDAFGLVNNRIADGPARDEVIVGVSCPCGRQFKTRKGFNAHRGARGNCPDMNARE